MSHAPVASMRSRRAFLRRIAAGGAGLAVAPGLAAPALAASTPGRPRAVLPPPAGTRPDEAYWEEVRAAFPLRPGIVPLNAANLCPAPLQVIEAVEGAGRDIDGDVSFQNRAKYDDLREAVRARIAGYLGVAADEVALVRNTSEGNNTVVQGLPLGPGDEVVVFDQNHPTNAAAWDVAAARRGFRVRRVGVPSPPGDPSEALRPFVDALGPATRAVALSDVSNTTGVRIPVRELAAEARPRGIHVHVDGAQSFGAEAVDLGAMGCDSYATSAHKWFMGPKEAGVLFVRRERIPELWPLAVGVGWGSGAETSASGARKFETLGQRNDAVFVGLGAALDLHEAIGPGRVEARVRELAAIAREGLAELGGRLLTSAAPELSCGVVVARFEGREPAALHQRLYALHGFAAAPTGGLRISAHVYNTRADVEAAVEAVGRVLAEGP